MIEPTSPPPSKWILLIFRSCYADEFDCAALIVTTRERWERAQAALREAYPAGENAAAYFDASFGSNESIDFTAESYIAAFEVHEISLACARGMAKTIGRTKPEHTYEPQGKSYRCVSLEWFLVVDNGVLPVPPSRGPGEPARDWLLHLAFHAPPAKCASHGNVIGECDLPRPADAPGYMPDCRRGAEKIIHTPDADYDALMGEPRTFDELWADKEREGYQYGREALENVRFGWELRAREEAGG